jgi:hypothetical protein
VQRGELSSDQTARLQACVGALMQHNVQPPGQSAAAGHSTEDRYDGIKVGHHGGHGHAHASPPVDDTDPDSNTVQSDPTASGD